MRPPGLGGNTRLGVFATRPLPSERAWAELRVKLLGIEKREGLGGSPSALRGPTWTALRYTIIKPYIPYADCHPEASGGFAPDSGVRLTVEYAAGVQECTGG